uniref:Uncharacterized protein n=1 Tax=Rhizophora mucronata TaxID=61149 RepID=A0A2P2N4W8_RHIMU
MTLLKIHFIMLFIETRKDSTQKFKI